MVKSQIKMKKDKNDKYSRYYRCLDSAARSDYYEKKKYLPQKMKAKEILRSLKVNRIIQIMDEEQPLMYEINWNLTNFDKPWKSFNDMRG